MPRKRWSDEIKAQAMADLAAGMTVKAVAEKYGMPRSTAGDLALSSQRGAQKIRKIADLQDVADLFRHHVALQFAAQEAMLRQMTDARYLARQPLADITAAYAGVFSKSGKLMGALYGPAAAAFGSEDPDDEDPT
jgi:hypothetical protein